MMKEVVAVMAIGIQAVREHSTGQEASLKKHVRKMHQALQKVKSMEKHRRGAHPQTRVSAAMQTFVQQMKHIGYIHSEYEHPDHDRTETRHINDPQTRLNEVPCQSDLGNLNVSLLTHWPACSKRGQSKHNSNQPEANSSPKKKRRRRYYPNKQA